MDGPWKVVDGIAFPEGMAWSVEEDPLLCSSAQEGLVYRVLTATGHKELIADVGGGANNVALAEHGAVVVCQNGGVDTAPSMARRYPDHPPLPPIRLATPGLIFVTPEGAPRYLVADGVNAPGDLAVGPGG